MKDKQDIALQEHEKLYPLIVENINEGIVMHNREGKITFANRKYLEMIGFSESEVLNHSIYDLLAGDFLQKKNIKSSDLFAQKSRSLEVAWKTKDGGTAFTILSARPVIDKAGQEAGVVSVLTDITEHRHLELEVKRSREELRNLSLHLQSVREKESKRIAREIHDVLGQHLTALKMDLSWISKRLLAKDPDQERILEKVGSMSGLIDSTIQTVQKISAELRPGLLDDLGLIPALEWLVQDFQNRTNIKCQAFLNCEGIDFSPDISTALFRIAQEALTNVTRHAQADEVEISFRELGDDKLELEIRDNGKGIREDDVFAPTSLGLMGMRERLHPFNGVVSLAGLPDQGTTLLVTFPRREAQSHD